MSGILAGGALLGAVTHLRNKRKDKNKQQSHDNKVEVASLSDKARTNLRSDADQAGIQQADKARAKNEKRRKFLGF